ncbi:hypothetical protein Dform_02083 [Dehalogenimonas formicexedens]|uniref:Uncharacterized protein n=1 Tax=Dehalogenimonas formicexedens TaxID=1839801 RepID=A0A1P8FAA9_9CHLR|nr:hypothetical protein [Dehalogenimonas formicexedens]APV45392.1 hypothetical protein Dform_02083 [Dehalogenimonas formicexedens]
MKLTAKRAKIFVAPIGIVVTLSLGITFGDAVFNNELTAFGFLILVFWLVAMFIDGLAQDMNDRNMRT